MTPDAGDLEERRFSHWASSRKPTSLPVMGLIRILVDGYSLLHAWPTLASGFARHSEAARAELIHVLTRYQDASGTPVSVIFDGQGARTRPEPRRKEPGVEVLFSKEGRTADDLIERAAYRLQAYGQVLVVTDDYAERDTVFGLGSAYCSCLNFVSMIDNAFSTLDEDVQRINSSERRRFRHGKS